MHYCYQILDMDTISKKIKAIREGKNIRQADIAKELGMERTNYHRLENRDEKLTIEQLKQIANALGVGVNELLDIEVKNYDNEKVILLEKRVLELEKWLTDKDKLNKRLEESLKESDEHREIYIAKLVSEVILQVAYVNKIGTVVEFDSLYDIGEVENEAVERIVTETPLKDYKPYDIIGNAIRLRLTESEQKIVLRKIISNRFYWELMADFIGSVNQLQTRIAYNFFTNLDSYDYILNGLEKYKKFNEFSRFSKQSLFPFFDKNGEIIDYNFT